LLTLILELDDILKIPGNASLSLLDATLKRSMAFCASYHGACSIPAALLCSLLACAEQYLQSPLQLEHACDFILDSELFAFHSERMCEILSDEAAVVSHGLVSFSRAWRTNAKAIRTQILTPSSCYTVFCSTMGDAMQASSAHTSDGSC
jgi:hypothetical protein